MKSIETEFKSDGFTSRLVWREGLICMFERTKPGSTEHYEVVILQQRKEIEMFGRVVPAHEAMPGSEKWGTAGWTYRTRESARVRFDALVASTTPADASEP